MSDDTSPQETPADGAGGFDFSAILGAAQQMQEQMQSAQAEMAVAEFEGVAGGGMVKVVVTGGMEFRNVTIDPTVVDPGDVPMLEDLVLAAIADAAQRVNEAQQASIGNVLPGGLGDSLGGLLGG